MSKTLRLTLTILALFFALYYGTLAALALTAAGR